jgi:glycosyltransferase involved in cell wall biosynthesis
MKIAFIGQKGIPATWGGVEDFVEQVATRLALREHEVTVYCRPYYTRIEGNYRGVRLRLLPSLKTKHLDALTHTIFSSVDSLGRDCDIIHYQALGPSIFSFIPRIFGKIKIVATIHSLDWKRDKWHPLARRIFKMGERPAIAFPDRLTAVSGEVKNYIEEKYEKPVERIFAGISDAVQRKPQRILNYGLESGKYILFLGRLAPEKGCHFLCQAFRELKTEVKLFVAGEGQFAGDYVSTLKKYASDKIIFGGYVDEEFKQELLSNCLAFVLPSLIEGFPKTILEAFSYGKAVLASDIPENKEALGPFQITFKNGVVQDLKLSLESLLKNEPSANGLPKQRMEYVQKNFSWDKTVEDLERIYRAVLNQ